MEIGKDTYSRGTPERPQYVAFVRYGNLPPQEVWLDATTDEEAIAETARRFGVAPEECRVIA